MYCFHDDNLPGNLQDEMGNDLFDKNGKPLIHTDGTGYVSLDIALKCPGNVFKGIYRTGEITEVCDAVISMSFYSFYSLGFSAETILMSSKHHAN